MVHVYALLKNTLVIRVNIVIISHYNLYFYKSWGMIKKSLEQHAILTFKKNVRPPPLRKVKTKIKDRYPS